MLKTIYLHGVIGKKFGDRFTLDVFSPLEAIRALCEMIEGFRQEFEKYGYYVVKGSLKKGWCLDEKTCAVGIGDFEEIHFIPAVAGAKAVGKALKKFAKVILGVVLIAAAFVMSGGGALVGMSSAAGGIWGALGFTSCASMAVTGTLLLIGGIAQATSKTKTSSSSAAENEQSFVFNGAQNLTTQGNPIPVVYGRMRVGSQVVSASMTNSDI